MCAAKDLLPGNLNHTVCSYVPHPTARPLQLTLVTSCCTQYCVHLSLDNNDGKKRTLII